MVFFTRSWLEIVISLILFVMEVKSMSVITQNLLTPMKEEGEACGYESCPIIKTNALNVHIIPHTHGELGYTRTFDSHFTGREDVYDVSNINMKRILDFVITELWKDPIRKFTFTDLPFLFKWWQIRNPTVHRMFYQLLRQGRIHIVGGGWSLTEESAANYHAIIDHFTFSLRKLNNTFLSCARPYVTWQSDSFGHTNEFASLAAQMGFDGHFINPISYDDELTRMREKRLEFVWRGSQDLGSSSDIFTHKLFDGYWSPPGFCFGGQCSDPLIVVSDSVMNNLEERVKLFVEAMKHRQSPHYATNHIMVVMGQRFGYYDAPIWFENIEKLIKGVIKFSDEKGYDVLPYYSTPICYLKAVYESNITLNMETEDFVPVAYDKKTHFSGIFSSRPSVKYAVRIGHIYLQICKQLQVLGKLKEYFSFFEDFHWVVGVMQDHNILSGSMRPYVRDYYVEKLYKSVKSSEFVIKEGIVKLLKYPKHISYTRCLFNISYCEYTDKDNYHIVIYNPLAWPVRVPIRLPCVTNTQYVVYGPDSDIVESTIMPIPTFIKNIPYSKRSVKFDFELVFFATNIPPFGFHSYYIEKVSRNKRSVNERDITKDGEVETDKTDVEKDITDEEQSKKDKYNIEKDITNSAELKKDIAINNEWKQDKKAFNVLYNDNDHNNEEAPTTENMKKDIINNGQLKIDKNKDFVSNTDYLFNNEKDIPTTEQLQDAIKQLKIDKKPDTVLNNDNKLKNEKDIGISTQLEKDKSTNEELKEEINFTYKNDQGIIDQFIKYNNTKRYNKNKNLCNKIKTNKCKCNKTKQISKRSKRHIEPSFDNRTIQENLNKLEMPNKTNNLKDFQKLLKSTQAPIILVTKSLLSHKLKTTRPERSLIKKIKNAKKKYLRRQTNNLKFDDQSLLKNNYDDEDDDSYEYDDSLTTTESSDNITIIDEIIRPPLRLNHIVQIATTQRTTTAGTDSTTTSRTTTTTVTTKITKTPVGKAFTKSKDLFIANAYLNVTLDSEWTVARINLANGVSMGLTIKFYYYVADDPMKLGRPHDKKPGAYVFKPMDNEPVPINEKTKVEVYKSELVEEIHYIGSLISYTVRLYKEAPYFELTWLCNTIPVADGLGKDVFVRYQTDLETLGMFYTDSNGRQTMKRVLGQRVHYILTDPTSIPGNFFPVTSKISIEDTRRMIRFSVFNDRTQGGSSTNGEIDLMLNRRLVTDDAGISALLNETEPILGKHHIYLTKLNSKPNRIFEKKLAKELSLPPQTFIPNKSFRKQDWDSSKKEFTSLNKKLPIGLNILTLQTWNDGTLLLRLENYLEKSDVIKDGIKRVVLKDLFSLFNIVGVKETTLAANIWLKDYVPLYWNVKDRNDDDRSQKDVEVDDEVELRPQQIRTFVIQVKYK